MPNHHGRRRVRARHEGSRPADEPLEQLYFGETSHVPEPSDRFVRKDRQLCRQVHEQLDLVLAELDDPLLDGIGVAEVTLVPHSHALRVDVIAPTGADIDVVRARLDAARGRLRSEIAAAIHRKRTPLLAFAVIPAEAWRGQEDDDHAP